MSVKVLVAGSKMDAFAAPRNGSYSMVPPSISTRPSCSMTMPLQNISQETVNCCRVCPLTGSRSNAPEPFGGPKGALTGQPLCVGGQFPEPATTNTLPLVRRVAWIGLMGTVLDNVLHWPCTFA